MHVLELLKHLAALLFSQDKIDALVHHELLPEDVLDLGHLAHLIEVNWHLKLLVVTSFNQTFRAYKGENDHFDIGLSVFPRDCLRGTDELPHVDTHRVKLVDQDLIDLQLGL